MQSAKKISPWSYIPSLYFIQGLPYIIINSVSAVMFTKMGVPNDVMAAATGFLYLPWVLKMFWSPLLEGNKNKKMWLGLTQLALGFIMVLIAFTLKADNFLFLASIGFFAGAFISATYDVAADGYYMLVLDKTQQNLFVGIRTTFYRLAIIFANAVIVLIAGIVEKKDGQRAAKLDCGHVFFRRDIFNFRAVSRFYFTAHGAYCGREKNRAF
ncbi:hypothetical protein Dip510_000551 [Elusimicrobium posterum]|uniref:hypothetical protein n=1 Tax=Elusimicrobium posterum TaxID=3116653 RepID=UPI003C772A5B